MDTAFTFIKTCLGPGVGTGRSVKVIIVLNQ